MTIRVTERMNHRYDPGPPRGCPMTALTGACDPKASPDEVAAWCHQASASFEADLIS